MKTADLYIRVSTDEQAEKGYSQRSQEEHLIKYCETNKIAIRKIIREDHSAKTFIRPAWKKYMLDLRSRKNQSNLLLFLKWDRFSRNAGDAYTMIKTLRQFGVEPQAIEQPLDLSIPENKMMLAFYLAAPEVENDRRALNVIQGMVRASKEGRYMGIAPYGYLNKTREDGRKHIVIDESTAPIVEWIFETIADGTYNSEQVYKLALQKDFNKTKSCFWDIIRNPVYCGKIVVRKFRDEERHLVKGLHEPIITETLYYQVQDVLDNRRRGEYKTKCFSDDRFPLRGFLLCPKCGRVLTASTSKGRRNYYSYYHCTLGCKVRFKTSDVGACFVKELKKYVVDPAWQDIYYVVLKEAWDKQTNHIRIDRKHILTQIKVMEDKLSHIRDLLSSRELDPTDFKQMKGEYTAKLEKLEAKLAESDAEHTVIEPLLKKGLKTLFRLDLVYENSPTHRKRELVGSMFPEKMTFDGASLRTGRINEAIHFIYLINKELLKEKTRTRNNFLHLSAREVPSGFEPL